MRAEQPRAEINVTPLIDVLLVLLILFMTIAPAARRGLETALPRPSDGEAGPAALLVQVEPEGFAVAGRPAATPAELEALLRESLAGRSARAVVVRTAGAVSYGRVVEALDAAQGAGAERIGVVP